MTRLGKRIKRDVERFLSGGLDRTLDVARDDAATLGTEYGAHTVALEPLDADSIVYSAGLGTDVSFDCELIDRKGLQVHGFDPTPESLEWLDRQRLPETFVVHDLALADYDGEAELYAPRNRAHVSRSLSPRAGCDAVGVRVRRLATLMATLGHQHLDVLKIDIEGAEYAVLDDLLRNELPVKQILVEYHHHFDDISMDATRASIGAVRAAGYGAFAVSSSGREWSFIHPGI